MESHVRTIAKSVSYRFFGFLLTTAIAWQLTGRPALATSIGLADTFVKLVAFYFHERLWLKVDFGRLGKKKLQAEG